GRRDRFPRPRLHPLGRARRDALGRPVSLARLPVRRKLERAPGLPGHPIADPGRASARLWRAWRRALAAPLGPRGAQRLRAHSYIGEGTGSANRRPNTGGGRGEIDVSRPVAVSLQSTINLIASRTGTRRARS